MTWTAQAKGAAMSVGERGESKKTRTKQNNALLQREKQRKSLKLTGGNESSPEKNREKVRDIGSGVKTAAAFKM